MFWHAVWPVLEGQFELLLVNPHHIRWYPDARPMPRTVSGWPTCAPTIARQLLAADRDSRSVGPDAIPGRTDQAQDKVDNGIQKLLEQCNIKLSSVVSNTLGISGGLMIEGIISWQDDAVQLADLLGDHTRRQQ